MAQVVDEMMSVLRDEGPGICCKAFINGIADDKIILDPGVGFGKTYEQNLITIKYMDKLKTLGYPLLLGTSRKSVIGLTLDTPVTDRVLGTAVTTVFAVQQGYAFVRVHDIKANKQAIQMTKAIMEA